MNSARWARVRAILEGALELEDVDRTAYLARECGDDADLRHEVESLLSVDARGGELRPPLSEELARAIEDPDIGRRVGPYTLDRRLGSGGMGVVYLAHRIDADFEQRVALKLIKRGMDSDEILQQFRRERALLAGLEHPCIARLLDGGSTEDGRPWLAMEHVEGRPIDVWCDEHRLTTRARVELFLRVTSAVRHAHQRLIVHRDLKPSNILVAQDGTPKLLDFGIAKLLAAPSAASSSRTSLDRRRLTPDYASPEQFHEAVVTTASDVYSLGVILYELLTGENPIRGVDVERRTDLERPSTRVRLPRPGFDRNTAARGRELRGDLDTIVLTALAVEPERRYASAEALELDLRRFLQGLPIEARPATAGYRLAKFVARNRLVVAATVAIAASLVFGLSMARAGYVEAIEQRTLAQARQDRAEKEARRADAVLRLTREMLAGASPHEVKDRDYTLRQLLDRFDARLETEAAGEPEVEASVRQIMARSYRELGMLDKAERHLERAFQLLPDARSSSDETAVALVNEHINLSHDRGDYALAETECDALIARLRSTGGAAKDVTDLLVARGDLRTHLARHEEAEADLRTALSELEAAASIDYRTTITCLGSLIGIEQRKRDTPRALELADRALGLARAHMGERSSQTARVLNSRGHVLLSAGRFAEAEVPLREAVAIERELRESDDHALAPSLTNLGRALTGLGRYADAEPFLREAIELSRKGLGPKHPSLASYLGNLGSLLEKLGDFAGAEAALRESLDIRVEAFGENSVEVARARNNLGVLLRSMGRGAESEQELRRALATRRALGGERDVSVASTLGSLGTTLVSLDRLDEAETNVRECLSIFRDALGPAHVDLASCLVSLSVIRMRRNDHAEARQLAEEALAMRVDLLGPTHPDVARSLTGLGEILAASGELATAEHRLREAMAMQRELLGDAHPSLARTLFRLGDVAERTARPIEARDYMREALSIWRASAGDDGRDTREAAARLAALLEVTGDADGASALRRELGLAAGASAATGSQ